MEICSVSVERRRFKLEQGSATLERRRSKLEQGNAPLERRSAKLEQKNAPLERRSTLPKTNPKRGFKIEAISEKYDCERRHKSMEINRYDLCIGVMAPHYWCFYFILHICVEFLVWRSGYND